MSTINPTFSLPFFRDIEVCPYLDTCRYSKVCEFAGKEIQNVDTIRQLQCVAVSVGQGLLGGALLLSGMALTLTLFLLPLGLPMALLGVALLSTSGEAADRSA